jgi:lysylphosphatidylglycerol synthetase-like protein (DUF2156 family)
MVWMFFFLLGKAITLFFGIYYFNRLPLPYKLVLYLDAIAMFCEACGYYISQVKRLPNAWLFNLYMPTEVWLMSIAAILLVDSKRMKVLFGALLLLNSTYYIYSIANHSLSVFAGFSMVFGCIVLSFMYIVLLFSNSLFSSKDIMKQPIFWLCASTILYFGCDIPNMGLHNFISGRLHDYADQIQTINSVLDVIRYPILAISFILLGRQGKPELKTA